MTSSDLLAERYGAPPPWRRRAVWAVSVVVAVAFLAWLAWTTWAQSTPEADSDLESFSVRGEHEAVATVHVQLSDPDVQASCTLRAYAEDHTVVGERTFTPTYGASQPIQETVRTERRATSVELVGCTTPDQKRPR